MGLLSLVVVVLAGAAPDKPSCVNINGTTAGGYNCKSTSGKMSCAQTPKGTCFDPPLGPGEATTCLRWN